MVGHRNRGEHVPPDGVPVADGCQHDIALGFGQDDPGGTPPGQEVDRAGKLPMWQMAAGNLLRHDRRDAGPTWLKVAHSCTPTTSAVRPPVWWDRRPAGLHSRTYPNLPI